MLIDPLVAGGMRKPKARTAEEQEAFVKRLEEKLAYLDEGDLAVLAEVVGNNAGGPAMNVWPGEVSILNWARAIRPVPDVTSRLVTSYLGSAAGRRAWDEGPEVAAALLGYLRQFRRPPVSPFDWSRIKREADDMRRTLERCERFGDALRPESATERDGIRAAIARAKELVFARGGAE